MSSLAECLTHYPSRSASNFLLEQLLTDVNVCVVLVMAGRATDSVLKYIPKGSWYGDLHTKNTFVLEDARRLLEEIKSYSESINCSQLNNKRKQHTEDFLKSVNISSLRQALCRLIVLEKESVDSLTLSCNRILRQDFNIPDEMLSDTINDLVSCVKESKESQIDAIPLTIEKLNKNSVLSVQPRNYVPRHCEETWIAQLKQSNALLLSGKPRVGKSDAARWIAGEFQKLGYSILLTAHVEEAERYLQDNVTAPRLAVIDDPLGGGSSYIPNKIHEKLRQLKGLIPSLRQNRKLIIAQGQAGQTHEHKIINLGARYPIK